MRTNVFHRNRRKKKQKTKPGRKGQTGEISLQGSFSSSRWGDRDSPWVVDKAQALQGPLRGSFLSVPNLACWGWVVAVAGREGHDLRPGNAPSVFLGIFIPCLFSFLGMWEDVTNTVFSHSPWLTVPKALTHDRTERGLLSKAATFWVWGPSLQSHAYQALHGMPSRESTTVHRPAFSPGTRTSRRMY